MLRILIRAFALAKLPSDAGQTASRHSGGEHPHQHPRTRYAGELVRWKEKPDRRPLILNGARQVGKTWLLREFGKREYTNVAYINCDNNPAVSGMFLDYDTGRLLRGFSALTEKKIEEQRTLLILDEVQEIPKALTALKYFAENAPGIHIAVAGSLLGIRVHEGTGFPVGKVDELRLWPMTFSEFLAACGRDHEVL